MMHMPEDPRPDVGCVVKVVAIIGLRSTWRWWSTWEVSRDSAPPIG